jgi:polyphosphate:nucleotide phosphotransferase, PPK2 family
MTKSNIDQKRIHEFITPYKVTSGSKFSLKNIDPADTHGLGETAKAEAKELLDLGVKKMAELQSKLYAQDNWALLCIFQAMDAAGKDSTIKHVMSGINPQGCQVVSFKEPSKTELDHDFMWRYQQCLPERGNIGIFNRSYYEEVLVVRVHENILRGQKIPAKLLSKDIWKERLEDIANFEQYLARNGIIVLKFFLHISKEEQKKRFLERLTREEKNWKFAKSDVDDRKCWKDYTKAYEDAIRSTAAKHAPWFIVPADHKWFARLVVAATIVETLEGLNLKYPVIDKAHRKELDVARQLLMNEK